MMLLAKIYPLSVLLTLQSMYQPSSLTCPCCGVAIHTVVEAVSVLQAVAVSLAPRESGGRVQLNLEALDLGDAYHRATLPPVHTSMLPVSTSPSLPVTSEIQPAAPDNQQVMAT